MNPDQQKNLLNQFIEEERHSISEAKLEIKVPLHLSKTRENINQILFSLNHIDKIEENYNKQILFELYGLIEHCDDIILQIEPEQFHFLINLFNSSITDLQNFAAQITSSISFNYPTLVDFLIQNNFFFEVFKNILTNPCSPYQRLLLGWENSFSSKISCIDIISLFAEPSYDIFYYFINEYSKNFSNSQIHFVKHLQSINENIAKFLIYFLNHSKATSVLSLESALDIIQCFYLSFKNCFTNMSLNEYSIKIISCISDISNPLYLPLFLEENINIVPFIFQYFSIFETNIRQSFLNILTNLLFDVPESEKIFMNEQAPRFFRSFLYNILVSSTFNESKIDLLRSVIVLIERLSIKSFTARKAFFNEYNQNFDFLNSLLSIWNSFSGCQKQIVSLISQLSDFLSDDFIYNSITYFISKTSQSLKNVIFTDYSFFILNLIGNIAMCKKTNEIFNLLISQILSDEECLEQIQECSLDNDEKLSKLASCILSIKL